MKFAPESSTVKQALSAHAAIGLIAGALLYLVCLTGTVVVLYEEWQRVEQPDAPEMQHIAPAAVQAGVAAVMAEESGRVPQTGHLYVHMPSPALPRTTITTDHQAVHLAADGTLAGPEEIAWSDFLLQLHYTLNLPSLVGITIVGALGVMILALALSGVIAHPRIFRDAFRLRTRQSGGVALADWHNRLSVWTLPFTLAIALTGALIGLASVAAYALAAAYYDGDTEAVYAPIFGEEMAGAGAPGVPDVAGPLSYMQAHHPGVHMTYAIVHEPGTAGQHVQIIGEHSRRLIFGEYYNFDARGTFLGTAGLADGDMGRQAAASTYNLHFGNYGGLPVKLAYILFGVALTAICATGAYIWLGKRARRGHAEPRLLAAWDAVVWGTPLALLLTFLARLVIGNGAPFAVIFWIGTAAILAVNIALAGRMRTRGALQLLLGVGSAAGLILAAA
ncbi:peptidase [Altererythrobacter sp. B11]|uniref:PepSY-associated TM helix domain-containing protein n=1 Tax=Altererythrobacter sp. B11 TaxID=2060312 RepID=UPI000DC6DA02|nr:PepSY-associated TM helix domain-containing protein [Altererythrobacter sp. B11]BBC70880.1 peptidase [Altererythrobacter sp. B11]